MMYSLIVLSCAVVACSAQYGPPQGGFPGAPQSFGPPAPVGQDGSVVDTPEVAQAKAAHFAEFARAAMRAAEDRGQDQTGAYNPSAYEAQPQSQPQQFAYQGPSPAPQSFARAGYSQPPQQYQPSPSYQQNFAAPETRAYSIPAGAKAPFSPAPLAEDGTVVDTPEVAALKNARLRELADAEARAYKYAGPQEEYSGEQGQYQGSPAQYQSAAPSIPRSFPGQGAYPGAPQGFAPGAPQSFAPQGAPQQFAPSARAYNPAPPQGQYQPQYQQQQAQSYQGQY